MVKPSATISKKCFTLTPPKSQNAPGSLRREPVIDRSAIGEVDRAVIADITLLAPAKPVPDFVRIAAGEIIGLVALDSLAEKIADYRRLVGGRSALMRLCVHIGMTKVLPQYRVFAG
jgi:hypothetical protein